MPNVRQGTEEVLEVSISSLTEYNNKLTVEQAAKIMCVTPQLLRVGLQQGRFPFGVAIRMKRWAYYINSTKFFDYMVIRR